MHYISWYLLGSFALLMAMVNTHQRAADRATGLMVSSALGMVSVIGILVFHGIQATWYAPLLLLLIGGVCGGLAGGLADAGLGRQNAIWLGYTWPIFAAMSALLIYRMP